MFYIGVDLAKNKHDCTIINQEGQIIVKPFTITNNHSGFTELLRRIESVTSKSHVKVGLEATGHYGINLINFLTVNGLAVYQINPYQINVYKRSVSLRRTKTDKVDSRAIATILMSNIDLKPYSPQSYHIEELKSLTRYRFRQVGCRTKLKQSVDRLVTILFPELAKLVSDLHNTSVYALLSEFPSTDQIANCHLTKLTNLLANASRSQYNKTQAMHIRKAARNSIGIESLAKSTELKQTIELIEHIDKKIAETDRRIKEIMDKLGSPITTIPGIGYVLGAIILAEVGDFSHFSSHDKILAYAGLSPTTYQSGQQESSYSQMEKRGSSYLRYALMQSAQLVRRYDMGFGIYYQKKRAEGKHHSVALSHTAKRLVRLIYSMEKSGKKYSSVQLNETTKILLTPHS